MTNRERINSMTDEEFCDWSVNHYTCSCCAYSGQDHSAFDWDRCREGMKLWLKQEYEEAQDENRGQKD